MKAQDTVGGYQRPAKLPFTALALFLILIPALVLLALVSTERDRYEHRPNGDGTITIIKYTGPGGNVSIPRKIKGLKVTGIEGTVPVVEPWSSRYEPWKSPFGDCVDLVSVKIPKGVTRIGDGAFFRCSKLIKVTIPDGVTSIGKDAFADCKRLTHAELPNSLTNIGVQAFLSCTNLGQIIVPARVVNLGDSAFADCQSLTNALIGKAVASLGTQAFYHCASLTNITIPATVTNIGNGAFWECPALTSIVIAAGNPRYSNAEGVLFDKQRTTLIRCPEGKAGVYTVPGGVTEIADAAFLSCTNLTQIVIGSDVARIGDGVFHGCTSLRGLMVAGSNRFYSSLNGALCDKNGTELIQYPSAAGGSYTVPDTIRRIGKGAFSSCVALTNVFFPQSVTNIANRAFCCCEDLRGVYFHGNAPGAVSNWFSCSYGTRVFYVPGTTGWHTTNRLPVNVALPWKQ